MSWVINLMSLFLAMEGPEHNRRERNVKNKITNKEVTARLDKHMKKESKRIEINEE